MSFSFGQSSSTPTSNGQANPTTSAPASGGLFGAASGTPSFSFGNTGTGSGASTPAAGGGLFGGNAGQKPGGLFGNAGAASTTPASAPAAGGLTAAPASGGLFGGASAAPAGGLFGAQNTSQAQTQGSTASPAPAPAAGGLFGGGGLKPPSTSAQQPAGTFGSQATPAKSLFSQPSTTPAGAPPAGDSKPAAGGLFGAAGGSQASTQAPATSQPAAASGGLFGGAAQAAPAPKPAGAAGLFGGAATPAASSGAGGLFGGQKPAAPAASSAGGLFGAQTQSATPATQPAPAAAAGGLFGAKPAASTIPATSAPATSTGGGLFGGGGGAATTSAAASGGLFGAKTTEASSTATPATAAPASSGLFGNQTSSTAQAKPAAGGLFGAAASTPASTAAPATAASTAPAAAATTAAAAGTSATPAASSGNALGASTTGPTSQLPRLKNKSMDDIITRWASDLSKYQKEFKGYAGEVSDWDFTLVNNGEKIQKLYLSTFEAEKASHEIERQLLSVESQQDELEEWLNRYEGEVKEMFSRQMGQGETLAGPDQERERTYKLAEKLTQHLDEKSRDLSKMVKEINEISGTMSKGTKPEDPLSQIVRVLNGHLTQLQWIDQNAAALQAKVSAAQKTGNNLGSQYGATETDAAESFYRSYVARR
ncbi:hypothetical protein VdG1_01271 [Verticillium dahliae VDG1]|nr:hypothetical protein VdG1_01271 [Verticillium dahliae VDG1]